MYSVVLMAALTTSTASPAWHRHCNSCTTCSGYAGYAGYSGYAGYACHGCHGCHAHIQGYGFAGDCYGYHGGCYGSFGNVYLDPNQRGYYGCYGGYACYGVPIPVQVEKKPVGDPFPPINPKKDKGAEEVPAPKEKTKTPKLDESVRAKVRIEIPDGGKLFVDGRHIDVPAGMRTFQTPELAPGQTYFYDIRIEVVHNGAIQREERRVVIHPGEDALVNFPALRRDRNATAQANR